jgi:hypothetical protein
LPLVPIMGLVWLKQLSGGGLDPSQPRGPVCLTPSFSVAEAPLRASRPIRSGGRSRA